MSNKSVAIFGASTGVAQKLIAHLETKNYLVTSYTSKSNSEHYYNLYHPNNLCFNFDCAIYFSWATDRTKKGQYISALAASEFARLARANNVEVVFISSLAALPIGRKSYYGIAKKSAEEAMRNYGHSIVRPATVLSNDQESISSAFGELFKKRLLVSFFSYFSKELNVPTTNVNRVIKTLNHCVDESGPFEVNLIDNIVNLVQLAGVQAPIFRLPFRWNFIGVLPRRSSALDRLLTVVSVSDWIKENLD